MTTTPTTNAPQQPPPSKRGFGWGALIAIALVAAIVTALLAALLTNIFTRKQEAKDPYLKLVNVDETTTDPAVWGTNWPREYDSYRRTVDVTRTRYGGSEGMPEQKLDRDPWLKTMYAGYAFSIDYRDRRGHAYMLSDQTQTERVLQKPQSGACLHCHASIIPTYRRIGAEALGQQITDPHDFAWPAVMKGFEVMASKSYAEAFGELLKTPDGSPDEAKPMPGGASATTQTPANNAGAAQQQGAGGATTRPTTQQVLSGHAGGGEAHPVSCVDCHDPGNMELRVTRPGFVRGMQALANSKEPVPHLPSVERWRKGDRKEPYDPNAEASRQEMRSFVCGQCHVEYYCATKETLLFPWHNGLKVEQIEKTWDEHKFPDGTPFTDFKHGITGAPIIYKAQHPEFEMWSQGVHARSGVSCADCHMPYVREGAMKVSDHWVRSPMLMVNRSCQVCHPYPEEELRARVGRIQNTTHDQMQRAAKAMTEMVDAIKMAKSAGASDQQLAPAYELQKKAQWRLDFVSSENSMGFHASQEATRILGESIDYSRQAQLAANGLRLPAVQNPQTVPTTGVQGVTPTQNAPPGPYKQPNNDTPAPGNTRQ